MHQKITLLIMIFLSGVLLSGAQSLVLKGKDGTTLTRQLGTVKRMTFSGNSLLVNYQSGPAENYVLTNLRSFSFQMPPTAATELELSGTRTMSIYPNPATEILYFRNAPDTGFAISVYSMNGVLMFQSQLGAGTSSLDIRFLSPGFYVLKTNHQAFKLIKR